MNNETKTERKQLILSAGVIVLFVIAALLSWGFAELASEVREGETRQFDEAVLNGIHALTTPTLDTMIPLLTHLGGFVVVGLLTLVALFVCILKKEYYRALYMALCMGGAAALNVFLKSMFERARPDLWEKLVHESSYSFPSGHSMMSAALGIAIIVVLWETRWRWWAVGLSALYIPLIGFTRMYLGVHYPTDVVGGWLIGGAWVMTMTLLLRSKLAHQALKDIDQE